HSLTTRLLRHVALVGKSRGRSETRALQSPRRDRIRLGPQSPPLRREVRSHPIHGARPRGCRATLRAADKRQPQEGPRWLAPLGEERSVACLSPLLSFSPHELPRTCATLLLVESKVWQREIPGCWTVQLEMRPHWSEVDVPVYVQCIWL